MDMGETRRVRALLALTGLSLAFGCTAPGSDGVSIGYEKYELENGLDVILHVDRSDPIAAVAMTFHVGSAREVPGKTGFAHLFEHLFFLDSENLGPGGLDRLMTRVGSSTNGSTSRDRTNYFEVVPVDGLEKTLWAEADKLGFFINTVTESVVDKERQVVKNEKRQGVDNQPYGHTSYVLDRALYPEGHPYRWQVIGSLEDLDADALRRPPLGLELAGPARAGQRQLTHGTDTLHARAGLQRLRQLVVEAEHLVSLGVPRAGHGELHGERTLGIEARVHLPQSPEGADHEPRADDQQEREGDLHGHQRAGGT